MDLQSCGWRPLGGPRVRKIWFCPSGSWSTLSTFKVDLLCISYGLVRGPTILKDGPDSLVCGPFGPYSLITGSVSGHNRVLV